MAHGQHLSCQAHIVVARTRQSRPLSDMHTQVRGPCWCVPALHPAMMHIVDLDHKSYTRLAAWVQDKLICKELTAPLRSHNHTVRPHRHSSQGHRFEPYPNISCWDGRFELQYVSGGKTGPHEPLQGYRNA